MGWKKATDVMGQRLWGWGKTRGRSTGVVWRPAPNRAAQIVVNRADHPDGNQGTRQQRNSRDDSQYESHIRFLFCLTQRIASAE